MDSGGWCWRAIVDNCGHLSSFVAIHLHWCVGAYGGGCGAQWCSGCFKQGAEVVGRQCRCGGKTKEDDVATKPTCLVSIQCARNECI